LRERRALRFVVEALFLASLAAALVVADVRPLLIAGVMLAGWLVVALYEWAATRELPHYGRGLPPRYYVPQVSLPPPRPLEQLRYPYPAAGRDDEATWIATPAMRAEALAGWPVDVEPEPAPAASSAGEDTIVVDVPLFEGASSEPFHEDTWIELDPAARGVAPELEAPAAVAEPEVEEPEAAPEVEPEPVAVAAEAEPAAVVPEVDELELVPLVADEAAVAEEPEVGRRRRWRRGRRPPAEAAIVAAAASEVADEPVSAAVAEPEAAEAVAVAEPEVPEPAEAAVVAAEAAVVTEPDVAVNPEVAVEPEEEEEETEEDVAVPVEKPAPVSGMGARHTFDPLADAAPTRRRWRRRDDPYVELPAGPPRPTALPGASRRGQ
jgi:hypothetical protein